MVSNRAMPLDAAIAGIAFNDIDNTILASLNDTGVIRRSILRTEITFVIPDYHSTRQFDGIVRPLLSLLEPVCPVDKYNTL